MNKELEILNQKLVGEFISRFSFGDTWDIFIGNYSLSAHAIEFQEEKVIYDFLKNNYSEFKYSIDNEKVPKCTILASNLRKSITQINLDEMKNITLEFAEGSTMKILTNTKIVDWQWCLNKSGKDPYQDYEIACFWAGEIKLVE
ncbi:hypothetical protein [Halpernia frigidisoli]|uniref:Uncharacterized protein n=1 Tax=Halpernia frigidisoli TaxID=1125876 RepID=A0A1I3H4T1_9FLAO|nr:hypothetical protein [Halpernia frigidisoli]SFI30592.1 hypothetical protein SAMN05443292_2184 [Halpernia frigidisoli]